MATASRSGRLAYLYFSTASSKATTSQTKMAEITDYTMTVERKTIDVTNHDSSGYDEFLSGTMNCTWEGKLNFISTGVQGTFRSMILGVNPGLAAVSFLQTTSLSSHKFVGKTRLTGFTQSNATNDAILGTVKGTISGPLTRSS